MDKLLSDVFYSSGSPARMSGVQNVYREAKKRNKKITYDIVKEYLTRQNAYTLHKPIRKQFERNKTKTFGLDMHWQSDLADMSSIKKYNSGYAYIVVCIDVLSRYAFAEVVKRKTPEAVGGALEIIMRKADRRPWFLMTDRGKEYAGSVFQDLLRKHGIQHHFATSPDVKCAIVERYIRTLKSRLWKWFTKHKTLRYVGVLQNIVKAINNSFHRTLGRAPATVNRKNQGAVWTHLYGKQQGFTRLRYNPGQKVRITKEKHKLSKGYLPNYTTEVFVISRVLNRHPATYKLIDQTGDDITGVFYEPELSSVGPVPVFVRRIKSIDKSEYRKKQLWHLVQWKSGKKQSWISHRRL